MSSVFVIQRTIQPLLVRVLLTLVGCGGVGKTRGIWVRVKNTQTLLVTNRTASTNLKVLTLG
jgi:hypothetical protein